MQHAADARCNLRSAVCAATGRVFFTDVVELGPTDFLEILKQARVNVRASIHAHARAVRQPVAARCLGAHNG